MHHENIGESRGTPGVGSNDAGEPFDEDLARVGQIETEEAVRRQ